MKQRRNKGSITAQHQSLTELIYNVKSAADGTVNIFDIPEGKYIFNVTAPGHAPYSGTFTIQPGVTTTVPIALELNMVNIEWSVVPTTIQDKYEIKVTQTYETNVPTPVLIMDPPNVILPNLQPGQVFSGEFTVTNYGLIAVYDVQIDFPTSFEDYDIEILPSAIPARIEAMQKVTIPYRITRRSQTAMNTTLMEETRGYGGSACIKTVTFTVRGKCVICPNTAFQRIVEKIANMIASFFVDCPPQVTTTTYPITQNVLIVVSSGGQAGTGAGTPTQPATITTNNPCDCKSSGEPCPDDGNICTADKCEGGNCAHPPDDSKTPQQADQGDCKKEICKNGTIVTIDDLNETAPVDDWAEEKFCALHSIDCINAYPLRSQSEGWANSQVGKRWGIDDLYNGIGDAARHAYWMCVTAEQFGVDFAEGLGNAHEEDSGYKPGYGGGGSGNPCCEKLMDLHNNQVGRSLVGQPGSCEEKVLNSLGQLQYDTCDQ